MTRLRRVSLALIVLVSSACRQDPTLVTPPTFERPGDVAFVCFDNTTSAYVPLDECDGYDDGEERYSLTALVTQTASGEVGAVDLLADRVLDLDVRVPGFTFVRVGEVPSGIIVPETDPSVTYVSNFGSRDVMWLETSRFRQDASPVGVGDGSVGLPDGPTSLALGPDNNVLYAALPRAGLIVPIRIAASRALETPDMADATIVELVEAPTPVDPPEATEYLRSCNLGAALRRPSTLARDPSAAGMSPRPEGMLVVDQELLVTDGAQPVIHRYAIAEDGSLSPLDPIVTGVPVRKIVVTPVVPTLVGNSTDSARFLYAIDALDQSVLAVDYLEGSPTFGAVLPLHVGDGPSDRIRLTADARSLGIVTPGFPGTECDLAAPGDLTISPAQLRGVFLAVGLTNGALQIVDVYDLDATCRGGAIRGGGGCADPLDDRDQVVSIERHRPRLGTFVDDGVTVAGTPTLSFEGSPGSIDEFGQVGVEGEPDLTLIDCPSFMRRIYPRDDEQDAALCASADPWSTRSERWEAIFEGIIPGASGVARFSDGLTELTSTGNRLCRRGVLGREDVTASMLSEDDPEFGYTGDRVRITSDPPSGRVEANEECMRFVQPDDGSERDELTFNVVRASDETLSLEPDPAVDPALYALGESCYGGALFEFEMQVRGSFLVSGSTTGFLHRITSTEDGCRVDTTGRPIVANDATTYINSRAFDGRLFQNPYIAFQLQDAGGLVDGARARLNFTLTDVPSVLLADIGSRGGGLRQPALVERIYFSEVDQRMYALDGNSDGFVQIALTPFQRVATFE